MSEWRIEVQNLGDKDDAWVVATAPDGETISGRARDLLHVAHAIADSLLNQAEHGPAQTITICEPVGD